jgi:hypothetical protein
MSIVELNVTTKNKFLRLYNEEEERIVDDAQKLIEHGPAIERNFGYTNPELVEEISRFREFKARFDVSRSASNVARRDHASQAEHDEHPHAARSRAGRRRRRRRGSTTVVFQRCRARGEHHEPLCRSAAIHFSCSLPRRSMSPIRR